MLKGLVKMIWIPLTRLDRLPCRAKLAVRPAAPRAATREVMFTPSWATALTPATARTTAFTREPIKLAARASTLPLVMAFFVSRAARRAKNHPPKKIRAARAKSPAKPAKPCKKLFQIVCQFMERHILSKRLRCFSVSSHSIQYSTKGRIKENLCGFFPFPGKGIPQGRKLCYNEKNIA